MSIDAEWLGNPLSLVQKLYEAHRADYVTKVDEYFKNLLSQKEIVTNIPSLNSLPSHSLPANSLVRFRCMIQDMYDTEFYLAEYETQNKNNQQLMMKSGRYKDIAECQPDEEVLRESSQNVIRDRTVYYCVPIPAETSWVKREFASANHREPCPSTSSDSQNRAKRCYDDHPGSPESVISSTCSTLYDDSEQTTTPDAMETGDVAADTNKRGKTNHNNSESHCLLGPNLNFPLTGETGPACLVKVYEGSGDGFKVNDLLEVIGVLSVDPAMGTYTFDGDSEHDNSVKFHEEAEILAHCPPPSLVPRIHCITAHKLIHNNPCLVSDLQPETLDKACMKLLCEAKEIRRELVSVFEQMLFGDHLAAEFLLCHIVSSVYARRDVMALGKFSMNLSGCPHSTDLPQHLYKILQLITTKVHLIPMCLQHMNERHLSPRKDYTANRLVAGELQLGDNTHLIVDETVLEQGQLNDTGVKNVAALGNLIQWQKVEYDMVYHKTDFTANIPVLVISEGKSLLPTDCRVELKACGATCSSQERYSAVCQYLTPSLLRSIRQYITLLQHLHYTISEQMQKVLEQHFVESRRADPNRMSHDDFNVLLVLTRLMSLSYGETTLSLDVWCRTLDLEHERLRRLQS